MPGNETHQQGDDELEEAKEYWTDERMREAQPEEPPSVSPDEMRRMTEEEPPPEPPGPELIIAPGEPRGGVAGTPYPANPDARPYWNCGGIFYTKPDGKDFRGSGAFCASNHIVLTAAHCVRDGNSGAWFKNVVFYRGYVGHWWGAAGQRVGIYRMGTKDEWVNGSLGNWRYDYAFCLTADASGAGYLGFRPGLPYSSWTSVGYPTNYAHGYEVHAVLGDKGQALGGQVQMLGNPFGSGASGGPWIGDLSTTYRADANMAIGVNSYTLGDGNLWGPYFDNETYNLLMQVGSPPG